MLLGGSMKKRIIAVLLIMAFVVSSLLACTKEEVKEPGMTKVVLSEVAHSIFYAPMYVAIEEGYFAKEGIDLELVTAFGVIMLVKVKRPQYEGAFLLQSTINILLPCFNCVRSHDSINATGIITFVF